MRARARICSANPALYAHAHMMMVVDDEYSRTRLNLRRRERALTRKHTHANTISHINNITYTCITRTIIINNTVHNCKRPLRTSSTSRGRRTLKRKYKTHIPCSQRPVGRGWGLFWAGCADAALLSSAYVLSAPTKKAVAPIHRITAGWLLSLWGGCYCSGLYLIYAHHTLASHACTVSLSQKALVVHSDAVARRMGGVGGVGLTRGVV